MPDKFESYVHVASRCKARRKCQLYPDKIVSDEMKPITCGYPAIDVRRSRFVLRSSLQTGMTVPI